MASILGNTLYAPPTGKKILPQQQDAAGNPIANGDIAQGPTSVDYGGSDGGLYTGDNTSGPQGITPPIPPGHGDWGNPWPTAPGSDKKGQAPVNTGPSTGPVTGPGTPAPTAPGNVAHGPIIGDPSTPTPSAPDPTMNAMLAAKLGATAPADVIGTGAQANLGAVIPPTTTPAPTAPAPATPAPTTPATDPTTPASTTPATNTDWSTGDWDANRVNAYFASRGVTPNASSADYWAQKWNEWGKSDPAYFLSRLSTAEEFGGGDGSAGGGAGSTPSGGGYASPATSPFTDQIRQILLGRIATDSAPFDPETDPAISTAMGAAQLTNDRQLQAERRALGEKLFAGGDLTSSTQGQQVQQSAERAATSLSTLKGQMVTNEIDKRRTDLTNLLQQAVASGDADLARQTQVALANLQAMVTREGYGWDWAKYQAGANAGAVGTALGG